MTRFTAFSSPLLLGFDEIERALERVAKTAGDGYPPYNIERVSSPGEPDRLRISLAVAGFSSHDLDVTVEENQLTIRGKQRDEPNRAYLHRGIAARQFQKCFLLAEGIEVLNANLDNGLLAIDLVRPAAQRLVRKVQINAAGRDSAVAARPRVGSPAEDFATEDFATEDFATEERATE